MDLRITHSKDGELSGPEYWNDYPLEAARGTVQSWVEDGVADWAEIRDDSDRLLFRWPRTVRPAS